MKILFIYERSLKKKRWINLSVVVFNNQELISFFFIQPVQRDRFIFINNNYL